MKHWEKDFDNSYVIRELYISLVRPFLEFASALCDPQYGVHSKKLESVLKQFLLLYLRTLHWNLKPTLLRIETI